MYSITKVCSKCDHNRFVFKPQGPKFEIVCSKCSSSSDVIQIENKMVVPNCTKCNSHIFKVQTEKVEDSIKTYNFTCAHCETPAEYLLIDDEGIQITKEQKEVHDIKKLVTGIIKKVEGFEGTLSELKGTMVTYELDEYDVMEKVDSVYGGLTEIKDSMSFIENQLVNLKAAISDFKDID